MVFLVMCFIPTDEQRLLDKLLTAYNPASRPVYNASDTVTVKFGLTLAQVSDMVCHNKKSIYLIDYIWPI